MRCWRGEDLSERAGTGIDENDGIRDFHGDGRISSAGAGGGHGRTVDSQDGRYTVWVRAGEAIWIEDSAYAAGVGAADPGAAGAKTVLRSGGGFGGSDCQHCRRGVSGKDADYASRPEWPGDLADFFVLGAR